MTYIERLVSDYSSGGYPDDGFVVVVVAVIYLEEWQWQLCARVLPLICRMVGSAGPLFQ